MQLGEVEQLCRTLEAVSLIRAGRIVPWIFAFLQYTFHLSEHGLLLEADALPQRAVAAAQSLARLSPLAFAQTKKQLRQEVAERVERSGAMTDATVTDIWTEALDYVRAYVARTLNKS